MTAKSTVPNETDSEAFERFLQVSEQRLRVALTASFGTVDGRIATLDALSWAWENWERLQTFSNPVGYLYRVGQTAARRARPRPVPVEVPDIRHVDDPRISPDLVEAIGALSAQQRTVVMLIHAFGWTVRDVAELLDLAPSTVQTHSERGLERLRTTLEETHDQ